MPVWQKAISFANPLTDEDDALRALMLSWSRQRLDQSKQVTVCPSPKGLPIATTKSPTSSLSESPSGKAVRFSAGILMTATGVLDYGIVRDDQALAGVDDYPRPRRAYLPLSGNIRKIEEATKERIVRERVLFLRDAPRVCKRQFEQPQRHGDDGLA
jgi:hypothetical protein